MVARDARERQPGALPELVVVDLGDRRPETLLQLRLRSLDVLALALQRTRLREMELDRENPHITGAQDRIEPNDQDARLDGQPGMRTLLGALRAPAFPL